jgi:hypothetical protein
MAMEGPHWLDDVEVRFLQPYQAAKAYLCPHCNRDIPIGTGHVVAVPREAPDLRRHWHRGCWQAELRRRDRPGRVRGRDR